jgi:hypothetical protein
VTRQKDWFLLMVIQVILLWLTTSKKLAQKDSLNASLLNKTCVELVKESLVEVKYAIALHLLLLCQEHLIKSE